MASGTPSTSFKNFFVKSVTSKEGVDANVRIDVCEDFRRVFLVNTFDLVVDFWTNGEEERVENDDGIDEVKALKPGCFGKEGNES